MGCKPAQGIGFGSNLSMLLALVETHSLQTLHTILSTGSPLKAQSYDYVYRCIKSSVLLGSISGMSPSCACAIERVLLLACEELCSATTPWAPSFMAISKHQQGPAARVLCRGAHNLRTVTWAQTAAEAGGPESAQQRKHPSLPGLLQGIGDALPPPHRWWRMGCTLHGRLSLLGQQAPRLIGSKYVMALARSKFISCSHNKWEVEQFISVTLLCIVILGTRLHQRCCPSQERTGESGAFGLWPHPRGSSRISS